MRFDKFFAVLVVFSLVSTVGFLLIADPNYGLNSAYSGVSGVSQIDTQHFNDSLNKIDDLYAQAESTSSSMKGGETDDDSTENSLFKSGFQSSKTFFRSIFSVPGDMMEALATELGVPKIFINAAAAVMFIFLAFGIIYLALRFKPQ